MITVYDEKTLEPLFAVPETPVLQAGDVVVSAGTNTGVAQITGRRFRRDRQIVGGGRPVFVLILEAYLGRTV